MKNTLLFVLCGLCAACVVSVSAQTINVKSADGTTDIIYTNPYDLQTAITNASAGSTITLSGGVFNTTNATISIDKEIHIVGAGYVVDSTTQTGRTLINGSAINLKSGSDNSSLEGFIFTGGVNIASDNLAVRNILINKVKVSYINCPCSSSSSCNFSNILVTNLIISNSIIGGLGLGYCLQISIFQNIITSSISRLNSNAEIKNNIFLGESYTFDNIYNTEIKNNIFRGNPIYYSNSSSGNIESNNLTTGTWTPNTNGNSSFNNISNAVLADIFQNYSAANATFNNAYLLDLHIKTGSAASGKGTDGTDLGIYGGDGFRAKPSIPFIEYKNVARQSNAQGQLPVNIRVKAQGNN